MCSHGEAILLPPDPKMAQHLPVVPSERIAEMEAWMDEKNEALDALTQFLLPGGHAAIADAHACRVVCRRAERRVISLSSNADIPEGLLAYLNRLSDVFFCVESGPSPSTECDRNSLEIGSLSPQNVQKGGV